MVQTLANSRTNTDIFILHGDQRCITINDLQGRNHVMDNCYYIMARRMLVSFSPRISTNDRINCFLAVLNGVTFT